MQYDIQPGIFDPVSNQDIGTFALDQWQYIKLDDYHKFLMSDIVLKQGVTVIPPSAYELAQDDAATAQEVGLSGDTLIGMLRITNISYTGVTLNITGNNFGTYVSNESSTDYVAAQIATKTAPSGSFIEDGESAIFASSSGLSIKSANTGEITAYNSGTTYSTAGTLVRLEGKTYSATGQSGNLNKDPRLPENAVYWFTPPNDMEFLAKQGSPIAGGMHTVNNRASANYQQNMVLDKKSYASTDYNFTMVSLDGTQVTGDATLVNIFNVGAANEYPYLDIYAPDVLGTRTLLDMGEHIVTPQSSGGENDTLGALLDDRTQNHEHTTGYGVTGGTWGEGIGIITASSSTASLGATATTGPNTTPPTASDAGTPRTGLTTRPKELTEGASYIIVMTDA